MMLGSAFLRAPWVEQRSCDEVAGYTNDRLIEARRQVRAGDARVVPIDAIARLICDRESGGSVRQHRVGTSLGRRSQGVHLGALGARVLVTGASRGIGRAIALRLASNGHAVAINYRERSDEAEKTAAMVRDGGGDASLLRFDVSDRAAARAAIDADIAEHGSYYGIVCNAGVHRDGAFPGMSDEAWDRVVETNLGGFYNVVRPSIMPMVRAHRGGRIVTIASAAGMMGNRGQVNYSASKAGLIGATRSLALEVAKRDITVNSVAPGLIATEMIDDLDADEVTKLIPMRRLGRPEEVASAVAFLFSDEAAYITGQVLSINGGLG